MSEALLGVLVGGFIASIAPIVNLFLENRRWQRQTKLEFLKSERSRLEDVYARTYAGLVKMFTAEKSSFEENIEMSGDLFVMLPKEVGEEFMNYAEKEERTKRDSQHLLFKVNMHMKDSLAKIDDDIKKLIG